MVEKQNLEDFMKILNEEFQKNNVKIIKEELIKDDSKVIGAGGFGKVYKSTYEGNTVALKEMILTAEENINAIKDIVNEVKFIEAANHEKVVKFHGVMIGKTGTLNLIFDYVEGKDLKHVFSDMDDNTKLDIIYQLCDILKFLHNKKLIHRDIKPANIMIENGNNVKLIDFGISKVASKTQTFTKSSVGTTCYMAPENFDVNIDADPDNDKPIAISGKTDMWAVGAMTSELFSGGIIPWSNKCKSPQAIEIALVKQKPFPIPKEVKNETAIKIIKACTELDPAERANAENVMEIIKS